MALVMALIMLVVLTMIAVTVTRSTNNSVRIVGNMQIQDEAEAAAQVAVEQAVLSNANNFMTPLPVSIANQDVYISQTKYTVQLSVPACQNAVPVPGYSVQTAGQAPNRNYYNVEARVTDNRTGANAIIDQGVRVDLLPSASCP